MAVVVIALLFGALYFLRKQNLLAPDTTTAPALPPSAPGKAPTGFSAIEAAAKPKPVNRTYKGCPAEGDGGDKALNRLKNRVDEGAYVPIALNDLLNLSWPRTAQSRKRVDWSAADLTEVARYEGAAIAVEGFLVKVKEEGEESCNCHGTTEDFHDFHLWLTQKPGEQRSRSLVVEVSPGVRAKHGSWAEENFQQLIKDKQRVRISGWLMLDPEHPDQIGKTRGTIWEIHPIMKVEVKGLMGWSEF